MIHEGFDPLGHVAVGEDIHVVVGVAVPVVVDHVNGIGRDGHALVQIADRPFRRHSRADEISYQLAKRGKELMRDCEFALTRNQASSAGGAGTRRATPHLNRDGLARSEPGSG